MQFSKGNNFGKGRPQGSRNKVNKEALYKLLERIIEDFDTNYSELSTTNKIKLLTAFKSFWVEERSSVNIHQEDSGITFKELVGALRGDGLIVNEND